MNWFGFELSAFLWIFVILNIVNVIIQTIKSIVTIKSGKTMAAAINALAYGLYTVVVVYMNADGLGLFWKAVIIGLANLVGVYVVKLFEEKGRKDKLWKVEGTLPNTVEYLDCLAELRANKIPCNYVNIQKYILMNCYCATQKETATVKEILDKYNAKYFASESKTM